MIVNYTFQATEHRIAITDKVKNTTNFTRGIWNFLKEAGWNFHGVVRDYSMIVSHENNYMTLHHFIKDDPMKNLIGCPTELTWQEIVFDGCNRSFLTHLESLGFQFMIPVQSYLDGLKNEWMARLGLADVNYHLQSPKHKFQLWAFHTDMTLRIEFFNDYPLAPYGANQILNWSDTSEVIENMDLFAMFNLSLPHVEVEETPLDYSTGENFELGEEVDADKLEETMKVISYTMECYDRIIIAASLGKDSSTTLQLYLHYYIQNPSCKAKLTIVSADTLIENPILMKHVHKTKERVESLNLGIDFHIVKPELKDTFYSCVFGKSMAVPSTLNKWCVSRLKIDPSTKLLESLSKEAEKCLLVLGTRSSESINRANSVKKHFGESFFGEHPIDNITTCSPIKHWSAKDVLTYLLRTETPWNDYSNHNIIQIYGSALSQGLECPIGAAMVDVNEGVSSCTAGKSPRLGCAFCSVIKSDISLINMARDYEELDGYVEMRKVFKASQDIRYGSLTGYKRVRHMKEHEAGVYEASFQSGFGDLTIDMRTLLLEEMLYYGITISEEEVHFIYQEVRKREFHEGNAVTRRFQDALFEHLPVHMGYFETTYSPIWDPYGCGVDAITAEDKESIERVMACLSMK